MGSAYTRLERLRMDSQDDERWRPRWGDARISESWWPWAIKQGVVWERHDGVQGPRACPTWLQLRAATPHTDRTVRQQLSAVVCREHAAEQTTLADMTASAKACGGLASRPASGVASPTRSMLVAPLLEESVSLISYSWLGAHHTPTPAFSRAHCKPPCTPTCPSHDRADLQSLPRRGS